MKTAFYSRFTSKAAAMIAMIIIFSMIFSGCSSSKLGNGIENNPSTTAAGSSATEADSTSGSQSDVKESSNASESTTAVEGSSTANPDSNVQLDNQTPKEKIKVRALYLTGWTVGSSKKVQHYIDLANTTEINSYVVDIKDDDGYVGYESQIPAVKEIGGWTKKYNVDSVLKAFHDNNIHVIGRIVTFKDPILSAKRPDLAVKSKDGGVWKDTKKKPWLDPGNKDSWPYLLDIAKEAVNKGFDEIQFDYVRYPNDGVKNASFINPDKPKYETIAEFLSYARKELPGVVLSADVFGIVLECPGTTGDSATIGQNLELLGKDIDYVSPMAYPSHYALGQIVNGVKFPKPDLDPYGVVYNTLVKGKNRIAKVEGYKAQIRPYIQDFTATWIGKGNYQEYGPEQVRQQIKAVTDAGLDEWIFWDAGNSYSESAFTKD